jgi:Glycosyltransferase sugar-binding region containing DXD motif/Glycosyl transferase family 2
MAIPGIIHQIWNSHDVPEKWHAYQASWQTHHPGWEFRLWTQEAGRVFIAANYPSFLPVYDAYPEPVMRADALRYCLLDHFGGVYADLDYECLKPIDAILRGRRLVLGREPPAHAQIAEVRNSGLGWLASNALIASVPAHSFWRHVLHLLTDARGQSTPLGATGPILLTRAYESFADRESIRLLDSQILSPMTQSESRSGRWGDPAFREHAAEHSFAVHHWANTWVPMSGLFPSLDACPAHLLLRRRVVMSGELHTEVLGKVDTLTTGPVVSCMMITRNRAAKAAQAIACFRRQSYRNRELLIVDDGVDDGDDTLEGHVSLLADPAIRFIRVETSGLTLGDLRNHAARHASGEYVAQWDDDDLSHPRRLELQMAAIRSLSADAAFLMRELIWWPDEKRLAISRRRVWESTMVCRAGKLPPYPAERKGEDTPVVAHLMREKRIALLDAPQLYTYVRHSSNTFDAGHFEHQWAAADHKFENAEYEDIISGLSDVFAFGKYPVTGT